MRQHALAVLIVMFFICARGFAGDSMDNRVAQLAAALNVSIDDQGNIPISKLDLASKLPLKFEKYLLKQRGTRAPDMTAPIDAEILNNNDIVATGCFLTCDSFSVARNTMLRKLVMNSMSIEMIMEKYELSQVDIGDLCIVGKRFDMTAQKYIPGDIHFVRGSTFIGLRSKPGRTVDIYGIAKALDAVLKSLDMKDEVSSAGDLSAAISPREREACIGKLNSQYAEMEGRLLDNLQRECQGGRKDKSYLSSLHAAILAVRAWRVARADDALLEVIDYTLDMASFPDGLDVSGNSFYPAARPLVELRVDIRKIIKAIRQADNEKRIKLLSWVLAERLGSDLNKAAEHLKSELEKCDGKSEKDNLSFAIGLLGKARHSDDLLPRDFLQQP